MESKFSIEGILSITLGISGIAITLFVFYSEINKQLKAILGTRRGELSKEQAKDFCVIYIDYIVAELHRHVDQTILDLIQHNSNEIDIAGKLLETYDDVRKTIYHIRGQTAEFCLINGMSFKQFIEEAHNKFYNKIQDGSKKLESMLADLLDKKIKLIDIRSMAHKEIEESAKIVKDIVKSELQKIYRT